LILKTEVKPTQIGLKLNNTEVSDDTGWSEGNVEINGTWPWSLQTPSVRFNFSSAEEWMLGGYSIALVSDLNLFANRTDLNTNWEEYTGSKGVIFSVSNNSLVNWSWYTYLELPYLFEETRMEIEFPADMDITWVSTKQESNLNRTNNCTFSSRGLYKKVLIFPVNNIPYNPTGFWKFEGTSPNYINQIDIYNNITGSWGLNSTFLSGNYINITANLDISPYIENTQARLQIRFPNGTIWASQSQFLNPDNNGF
ncbi:unnamed protein product, partial [marine sediment metagenome]